MTLHHLLLAALLAANPPAAPSPSPTPEPVETEDAPPEASPEARAYSDSLHAAMRRSASPRERALGALFYSLGLIDERVKAEHAQQLKSAAQSAPGDALVQFAWAMNEQVGPKCQVEAACREQRLAATRVEPGNGMAWLLALRSGLGPAEVDGLLARAAQADHFDDHFADAVQAWAKALDAHPMSPALVREFYRNWGPGMAHETDPRLAGKSLAFAYSVPFTFFGAGTYSVCDHHRQPELPAARLQACAQLGRKMLELGTTDMMLMTGIAIVKRTGLATPEDLELVRRHRWRMAKLIETGGPERSAAEFRTYYDDLVSSGSEIRAQELLLQRHGLALDPPAGWKPDYE